MDDDTIKKVKFRELEAARTLMGAKKKKVEIEQGEWDAIQAGAISNNMLERILKNTDMDKVKVLATPKRDAVMTQNYIDRARRLFERGYTRAEVAADLGVSVSTLDNELKVSDAV